MRRLLLAATILAAIAGLASCSNSQDAPPHSPKTYKTNTGKTIVISETHPVGQSLSTVEISTRDFEHNYREAYENWDPVSDVFIADLDGNGFDEIYIVTTSAGSGSYGKVMGFASNKDKSLSTINFPDIQKEDKIFEGYMGHDVFSIEDQKLVRTFPIYNKDDTNQNPTSGKRKVIYGLYQGEADVAIKGREIKNLEINNSN